MEHTVSFIFFRDIIPRVFVNQTMNKCGATIIRPFRKYSTLSLSGVTPSTATDCACCQTLPQNWPFLIEKFSTNCTHDIQVRTLLRIRLKLQTARYLGMDVVSE
jgi:hypothetical protein